MESLHDKTLVMVIGPAAIGKSTLMHEAVKTDGRFSYVSALTTRPVRAGQPTTYRHVSETVNVAKRRNGKYYTDVIHPTTGHTYATDTESYRTEINLLDTLTSAVAMFQALPFKRTVSVSLTAEADDWQRWFLERYPEPSSERMKRLQEALQSIEWSLAQANHHWIVNTPDNLTNSAAALRSVAYGRKNPGTRPSQATALYERVKLLVSYEQERGE